MVSVAQSMIKSYTGQNQPRRGTTKSSKTATLLAAAGIVPNEVHGEDGLEEEAMDYEGFHAFNDRQEVESINSHAFGGVKHLPPVIEVEGDDTPAAPMKLNTMTDKNRD